MNNISTKRAALRSSSIAPNIAPEAPAIEAAITIVEGQRCR